MALASPAPGGRTVATSASDLVAKIKALPAGDHTIGLADGHHGAVVIDGWQHGNLTIVAENPGQAIVERMTIKRSSKITVRSLWAMPKADVTSGYAYLFDADGSAAIITFDGCHARGREDAANHADWTLADWKSRMISGFAVRGPDSHVRACSAMALRFGFIMGTGAVRASITDCLGEGLSADGGRATGDDQTFARNRITDLYKIDANHPDLFQAFGKKLSAGFVPLRNLTLEDNVLLEWTRRAGHPLRPKGIQGIGMFNAPYIAPKVRRNRVANSHPHGISIYGGQGTILEDNVAWNVNHGRAGFDPKVPRIGLIGGSVASLRGNVAPTFVGLATGSPVDYAQLPAV